MVRQIILASFVVVLPVSAQAQGRGMMPPVSHAVGVAPRVVVQAPPHVGISHAMPAPRIVVRGGGVRPKTGMAAIRGTRRSATTRRRFEDEDINSRQDCNSAPGLGFDAVHQAAVCGGAVDSGRRGLQVPFFFPFFDGGFFVPGTSAAVEEGSTTEASQQEAAEAESRERSRRYRASLQAAAPAPESTPAVEMTKAAPPENDEFVFVRRDGTVFFAVAYSWENGTLRYVTSEGLRRTVKQDALDMGATQQFNEQRGLNFRLPA